MGLSIYKLALSQCVLIRIDAREGQGYGMFQRAACLLSELKALRASTNSTASISPDLNLSLTACMAASVPPICHA